jgi:membrane protease YdiL (CAAX protease family)
MTQLAAPATRRAELWRTLCGLLLSVVFSLLLIVVAMIPLAVIFGPAHLRDQIAVVLNSNTIPGVLGLLYSFLPQMIGLMLAVLVLMRRNPVSLIGPPRAFLRNFVKVGLPMIGLWLLAMPLSVMGDQVVQNITFAELLPWLPAALLGLLIQTATEELVFRGYLQQQLAARFRARWVWLGVPSVLFGLAHYSGQYPPLITGLTMLWAGLFGLACADLTARTGNLGAGLALHFTNNISAILLVGMAGNIGGLTLYQVVLPPGDIASTLVYMALDGVSLLVSWLLARLILRV